jgi:radical SAM protein with 4Fe4S-binding SPASM domain
LVSPDRYLSLLDDLVESGHRPFVYFWGGEPMLYDGLVDLVEGAAALGLPVSIATNGTGVAAAAERFVRAPLGLCQLSIDGPSPELHNQARPGVGKVDNFSEVLTGLEAVNEARRAMGEPLPLIVSLTVISRANQGELVEIYETFRDKVDLFVFYLSWWIDEGRARAHDRDFSRRFGSRPRTHWGWIGNWIPDDYELLDSQIAELKKHSRPLRAPPVVLLPSLTGTDSLKRYYTDHEARFGFDRCVSIYQAVEINSNGDLSPCRDYHDYVVGNVKTATITQLWNATPYRDFRKNLDEEGLMPVCSRCCGLMGF